MGRSSHRECFGRTIEDFADMAAALDEVPGIAALEVNVSCPNINAGGFCFGWDADMTADVTKAVRAVTTLPLIVKLSPGALDVVEIAQAAEEAGADAVSLINTLVGMSIDTRRRKPTIANVCGGLSGPAVKPVAVRMVRQVAQGVTIPVIGLGGITSLNDALEFFMAGASAIQIGTAMFVQPTIAIDLIDRLPVWLESQAILRCRTLSTLSRSRFRAKLVKRMPPPRNRIRN
ncbi:MAG: dihydroorotate dehydrogenase [Thermomicrobiales bacterium]